MALEICTAVTYDEGTAILGLCITENDMFL